MLAPFSLDFDLARPLSGIRRAPFIMADDAHASYRMGAKWTPTYELDRLASAAHTLVKSSTRVAAMPTVNFSIPEAIQAKFNEVFRGRNKSQIVSALMQRAIEEEAIERDRQKAIRSLLKRRVHRRTVTEAEINRARSVGRPWPQLSY
jgi:hypothetical protein